MLPWKSNKYCIFYVSAALVIQYAKCMRC